MAANEYFNELSKSVFVSLLWVSYPVDILTSLNVESYQTCDLMLILQK